MQFLIFKRDLRSFYLKIKTGSSTWKIEVKNTFKSPLFTAIDGMTRKHRFLINKWKKSNFFLKTKKIVELNIMFRVSLMPAEISSLLGSQQDGGR